MKRKPSSPSETSPRDSDPEDPLVCYCMKIPRSSLVTAIAAGSSDLKGLMAATRAGTGCGTCRMDLISLLRETARGSDV